MQKQKKLTLQEYIECHNIKKQLQQRSKSKSRGKPRQKSPSKTSNQVDQNETSSHYQPQNSVSKTKISQMNHQQLNKSIYSQIDFRAKNLYQDIQYQINQIKLQVRQFIKNDKNYAFFIKLMDGLMLTFRKAVMHIHRENLLLIQMSYQDLQKTLLNQNNNNVTQIGSREDLARTVLEKSFDDRWLESKNQYQTNLNFMPTKSIKQRMRQTKKGDDLIKTIFGGGLFGGKNQNNGDDKDMVKVAPKKYDKQPQNQEERARRKQQATSFLGFIMKNLAQQKQNGNQQNKSQNKSNKQTPTVSFVSPSKKQEEKPKEANIKQVKQIKNPQTQTYSIKPPQRINVLKNQGNQGQKILKNINFLNSSGRVNIDTQQIDNYYDQQNISFGGDNKKISSRQKVIPKSSSKQKQKKPLTPPKINKINQNAPQSPKNILQRIPKIGQSYKPSSKQKQRTLSKNQPATIYAKNKSPPSSTPNNIPKSPPAHQIQPRNPQNVPPPKQLIRRTTTNSKSKGKPGFGSSKNILAGNRESRQKVVYFQRK